MEPYSDQNVHHRVIADHLRSTSFLIADGVLPSNEGRGYVLRRIMRRAMRHAHLLGSKDPLMHLLVAELVRQMGQAYPELIRGQSMIEETLLLEETRFKTTLDRGLRLLDAELEGMQEGNTFDGKTAFKLYDTFGFPLDLTQDALREKGLSVDVDGFDSAMAAQKAKARAAWAGSGEMADDTIWFDVLDSHGATDFLDYDTEQAEGQIVALVQGGGQVNRVEEGSTAQVVLNQTPFYAESGGQIGDRGVIVTESGTLEITDCRKTADLFIHMAKVTKGFVELGQAAELAVASERRARIRANHSGTHLLHEALRRTLGAHVAQRGSLNADDRLRFDFSHGHALTAAQIKQVQSEVNGFIRQNSAVETRIMTPDDARALGAQALFGEKYGDEVRVVSMGHLPGSGKGTSQDTYSLELCGGTHVRQTGDIGGFVLLSDGASSAGVRRIEALTGEGAEHHIQQQMAAMAAAANTLKVQPAEVADRAQQLLDERKALQNEVASLRRELAMSGGAEAAAADPISVGGKAFLAQVLQGVTGRDLPALVDAHKAKMGSGVVLLIADADGKAAVAAGVTSDLTEQISAVDIVKTVVATLGGKGGGGRADMAQGGAKSTSDASAAISTVKTLLEG